MNIFKRILEKIKNWNKIRKFKKKMKKINNKDHFIYK